MYLFVFVKSLNRTVSPTVNNIMNFEDLYEWTVVRIILTKSLTQLNLYFQNTEVHILLILEPISVLINLVQIYKRPLETFYKVICQKLISVFG